VLQPLGPLQRGVETQHVTAAGGGPHAAVRVLQQRTHIGIAERSAILEIGLTPLQRAVPRVVPLQP
jgi:hypothetical protein